MSQGRWLITDIFHFRHSRTFGYSRYIQLESKARGEEEDITLLVVERRAPSGRQIGSTMNRCCTLGTLLIAIILLMPNIGAKLSTRSSATRIKHRGKLVEDVVNHSEISNRRRSSTDSYNPEEVIDANELETDENDEEAYEDDIEEEVLDEEEQSQEAGDENEKSLKRTNGTMDVTGDNETDSSSKGIIEKSLCLDPNIKQSDYSILSSVSLRDESGLVKVGFSDMPKMWNLK
ncbi:unnamed protein product [Toxocara canis]|uniref:Transmembrane protein n=1 Tax=Toxocara canis TaxID=6265 RepID=A0A183TVM7_TOXCA|nr:unnamed protein product [Toxocara canis]